MKKQINYKVSGEEWKEAKDRAFNKIVKKVKIDVQIDTILDKDMGRYMKELLERINIEEKSAISSHCDIKAKSSFFLSNSAFLQTTHTPFANKFPLCKTEITCENCVSMR